MEVPGGIQISPAVSLSSMSTRVRDNGFIARYTAGIARALGEIARAKGMTQVAKDAGLSRESFYRALSARENPGFASVLKVVRALGVRLHADAA
jgi:probable addiction module antidote protein